MATVIECVDRLEQALEDFITNVGIGLNKLYNSQMRTEALVIYTDPSGCSRRFGR